MVSQNRLDHKPQTFIHRQEFIFQSGAKKICILSLLMQEIQLILWKSLMKLKDSCKLQA